MWLDPSEQGHEIGSDEAEENSKGADTYLY